MDICIGAINSEPALNINELNVQLYKLYRRSIELRLISDIAPANLPFYKALVNSVKIRHLSGIKGNFAIIDGKYFVADLAHPAIQKPSSKLLHSDARAFVEYQQYVFDTLWNKAIPGQDRMIELEEGIPIENTEVVQGTENIVRSQIEGLARSQKQHDACVDQTFPASLLSSKPVWDMCLDLQRRGIQFRTITEITPKNIEYCKEMMTRMDLRHLNDIKGNFSIRDRVEYRGAATMREGEPPTQGILSTSKVFVDNQQYFFETLWNKALPAEQRIKEIEKGVPPEVVEVLSDAEKTQQFACNLVSKVGEELMVMFASVNEFRRQTDCPEGFLQALSKLSAKKKEKMSIRIALPNDKEIAGKSEMASRAKKDGGDISSLNNEDKCINLRHFGVPLTTRVTIIIVDRKYVLVIEPGKDSEESISRVSSSGLAIYSNSKAIVLSYVSIFELLWTHIDLYQEIKAREAAEREFINIAVHELRAPIQPILGLAEVIRARQGEQGDEKMLGVILRSASNLQRLADNLLDVARIQNNTLRLSPTDFDLNELISVIFADYAIDAAKNKGVGMQFHPTQKSLQVRADRNGINQVITNCLQNAVKFTAEGSIVISTKKVGKVAMVSIKDNGCGIDPDILPRLFTKFTAGSSSTGTGIGLFISKRIIEAHGGQITGVNNTDQNGATFEFSIPLDTQLTG